MKNQRKNGSVNRQHQTSAHRFYICATAFIFAISYFLIAIYSSWQVSTAYLVAINIAAFAVFGIDKAIARSDSLRVPEIVILSVAFIGGSLGVLLAMEILRHKTKKTSFKLMLTAILFIELLSLAYIMKLS